LWPIEAESVEVSCSNDQIHDQILRTVKSYVFAKKLLLAGSSKYRTNIDRAKGVAIGDHSTVHGNFHEWNSFLLKIHQWINCWWGIKSNRTLQCATYVLMCCDSQGLGKNFHSL